MTSDEFEVDATPCKTVQRPVFRAAIDTPEPRAAEVCEPGAELKPQQSEQPKDEIAVGGRVRHDLLDFEARFVLEQAIENVERVADRPGDDDGVKPGELVAREIVVGDASAGSKVPRVRPGVEGSDRYDEAKPVGGGDLASAPVLGQGDRHLAVHKGGVGLYQGLGTKVVLFDPTETPTSQRWVSFRTSGSRAMLQASAINAAINGRDCAKERLRTNLTLTWFQGVRRCETVLQY